MDEDEDKDRRYMIIHDDKDYTLYGRGHERVCYNKKLEQWTYYESQIYIGENNEQ